MWLTNFKTALVLEDFENISRLLEEMPQFETLREMEEASYLLAQTKTLVEKKQTPHCTCSATTPKQPEFPQIHTVRTPLFLKSQILTLFSPFFLIKSRYSLHD